MAACQHGPRTLAGRGSRGRSPARRAPRTDRAAGPPAPRRDSTGTTTRPAEPPAVTCRPSGSGSGADSSATTVVRPSAVVTIAGEQPVGPAVAVPVEQVHPAAQLLRRTAVGGLPG